MTIVSPSPPPPQPQFQLQSQSNDPLFLKSAFLCVVKIDYKHWHGVDQDGFSSLINEWQACFKAPRTWEFGDFCSSMLVWMRQGFSFTFLSSFLEIHPTNLRRQFFRAIHKLRGWAQSKIYFPSIADWQQISQSHPKLYALYPNTLFFWIDGTVVKVWCPKDSKAARSFYNKKHGHHAYVFFIVVMPNGSIVYLSNVMDGTEHDKTHWNLSDGPDLLAATYPNIPEGLQLAIGGDKAYGGVRRPEGWANHVTRTVEEETHNEESVDQNPEPKGKKKEWWCEYTKDPKIARYRAVIERSIGAMKKWQILANEALISRVTLEELHDLLLLIAALTNVQLKTHNTSW